MDEIRKRAFELSQENPEATPEQNWLQAEAELRAAKSDPHEAERKAAEAAAALMASAEMTVHGHP